MRHWLGALAGFGAIGLAALVGCGSSDDGDDDDSSSDGSGGSTATTSGGAAGASAGQTGGADPGSGGTGGVMGTGGGTGGSGTVQQCARLEALDQCGWQSEQARFKPVEILIVMDKSASMDEPFAEGSERKWPALRRSIRLALEPLAPVIQVGLELFPARELEGTGFTGTEWCTLPPADGTVDVGIGQGVETVPLIADLLTRTNPGGGTPTAEALRRAYEHFRNLPAIEGSGGDRYVILATDGGPNCTADATLTCEYDGCVANLEGLDPRCPTPEEVASGSTLINCCENSTPNPTAYLGCVDDEAVIAQIDALWSDLGVRTIVIGIPGSEPFADYLDQFAIHGQSPDPEPDPANPRSYYAVTSTEGASGVEQIFRDITADLIHDCEIWLEQEPSPPSMVNVAVDCVVVTKSIDDDGSGWSFDDDTAPTRIIIEGELCDEIRTTGVERVDVVYGCATIG